MLNCCLLAAAQASICLAQTPDSQDAQPSASGEKPGARTKSETPDQAAGPAKDGDPQKVTQENDLGVTFLKHLLADQKAIWTSPAHLRWADGSWLFPLAAATGGFFATDRAVPPALSTDQAKLNRYVKVSDYGLYSMIGVGGGLYIWGKLSHDDHQRETGILAGEAAINSLAVNTVFKYAFGRARPNQDGGLGDFFQHGTSFASDHSVIAWSIASVFAHEYPGPLTQIAAYGLATTISATREGRSHGRHLVRAVGYVGPAALGVLDPAALLPAPVHEQAP